MTRAKSKNILGESVSVKTAARREAEGQRAYALATAATEPARTLPAVMFAPKPVRFGLVRASGVTRFGATDPPWPMTLTQTMTRSKPCA